MRTKAIRKSHSSYALEISIGWTILNVRLKHSLHGTTNFRNINICFQFYCLQFLGDIFFLKIRHVAKKKMKKETKTAREREWEQIDIMI